MTNSLVLSGAASLGWPMILAAKGAVEEESSGVLSLIVPVMMILIVIALLIGGVKMVRKHMFAGDDAEAPVSGFSLGQLRQLVKQGKMTQEEFDAAKAQIIAATQRETTRNKPPPEPGTEPKLEELL